jgi:hypothetical protein
MIVVTSDSQQSARNILDGFIGIPFNTIEVSIIGDNMQTLLLRHSGAGRNPMGLFNMFLAVVPRCGSFFLTGFRLTLTSILSRRERRRLLFPHMGESWIEGWPE